MFKTVKLWNGDRSKENSRGMSQSYGISMAFTRTHRMPTAKSERILTVSCGNTCITISFAQNLLNLSLDTGY